MFFSDNPFKKRTTLEVSQVKKILIVMVGKGIGDAIVMTGLVKALADSGYQLSILAEPRISHIFSDLSFIRQLFVFNRQPSDQLVFKQIKLAQYDLLIDLDDIDKHSPLRIKIIRKCAARHTLGVNQSAKVYDTSLKNLPRNQHISTRHLAIANLLQANSAKLTYIVATHPGAEAAVSQLITQQSSPVVIVINPYGTEASREMSTAQINALCDLLRAQLNTLPFILGVQDKIDRIPDSDNHIKMRLPLFSHAIALVNQASLVISTDTSIVHLCNALNKKLVCLYNNKTLASGEENNIVWGPNYPDAFQVFSPGKRIDEIDASDIFHAAMRLLTKPN